MFQAVYGFLCVFIRDAKEIIGKYIGLGSIEMPFSRLKQLSKAAVKRKSI